jgi:3-hydroxyisobutyrate dehydrogenase-like beta-hydroxyacid dehydrogenase
MDIGFIGLGRMGAGMAANLVKAGHHVTVYNRSPQKAQPLVAAGAKLAPSVAGACRGDVVFTMLADDAAIAGVTFGDDGILASLAEGATHISSSTISVAMSERLTGARTTARARSSSPHRYSAGRWRPPQRSCSSWWPAIRKRSRRPARSST